MAKFNMQLPDELIKTFETLNRDTEKMLGEMCKAGADVVKTNMENNMPPQLRKALRGDIVVSRAYKTPTDDGINSQAMVIGYFVNENGQQTPAALVANMFEYGSSKREYPKQPFLRRSFKKTQITAAMLKVQERYIKGG